MLSEPLCRGWMFEHLSILLASLVCPSSRGPFVIVRLNGKKYLYELGKKIFVRSWQLCPFYIGYLTNLHIFLYIVLLVYITEVGQILLHKNNHMFALK